MRRRELLSSIVAARGGVSADVRVVSSPFSRAKQTAQAVARRLGPSVVVELDEGLRERFFGAYDRTSTENYVKAWRVDALHADDGAEAPEWPDGIESPAAVAKRALAVVRRLEGEVSGARIALVAHGDLLSILRSAMLGLPLAQHRETGALGPACVAPVPPADM